MKRKIYIPNDFARCTNLSCDKRSYCKRYMQMIADLGHPRDGYSSLIRPDEKDCKHFIDNGDKSKEL